MAWKRHLRDFSGSTLASGVATAVDGVIYWFLLQTFVESTWMTVGYAAAGAAVVGGIIHYALSRFWVFRRFDAPLMHSATLYFAMSWMGAAGHGFMTDRLAWWIDPRLAWFASKGVVWLLWTYPVSRYVVFGGLGADESGG